MGEDPREFLRHASTMRNLRPTGGKVKVKGEQMKENERVKGCEVEGES